MDSDPLAPAGDAADQSTEEALVEEELLVEEISIDGMCGVY
jgi:mycofactocin precursor